MDLSIIIVNWNSAHFLRKCLSSIYGNAVDLDFEVIVVDNASYDGSDRIIREEFPTAQYVQSEQNIGFARANNLGTQGAKGEYFLFLNPDTEVLGPAINMMLISLQKLQDGGAIGCKLLNSDHTVQTSCILPFPTILNQLLDIEKLKLLLPGLKFWGIYPLFSSDQGPFVVEAISGASIMINRKIFEQIEGFSQDYFMYTEDVDLCYKIQQIRRKVYYIGNAEIIHHGGGSTKEKKESYRGAIQMRESRFKFFRKYKGIAYAIIFRFSVLIVSIVRLVLLLIAMMLLIAKTKKNSLRDSFTKWHHILRWSVGLETWTK